ncbi:MAG TPA: FAD-dependent oxidoreductase [Longimicrobiaceae bacterium]|nr:FAD-dependent oxidoreductase [Longimicrobiaceae bacterium]
MIAIVGGGLTGLALAHQLARRGVPHVVLEAADRPGGVVRSARVDGHLLEWGPQRTRLTAGMEELVRSLGIEGEVITAPPGLPLFVYRAGRLRRVPFSAGDFLRSDIFSPAGKLRVLLEPFTGAARAEESVAGFFTRKVGREAYENLLGPLYGGLYASDPATMEVGLSLGHALREFGIGRSLLRPLLHRRGRLRPPPATSFREGMQTLPLALYEANRPNVRLSTSVEGLRGAGSGFVLDLHGDALLAEQVVLTVPAPAAAQLLDGPAPDAARRISSLNYNPLAVVHVRAETGLRGLGYQVSLAEPLWTRGVTFNDSLFGRTGVHTIYLGGAKNPQVETATEQELAERALREFRLVTGADAEVLSVDRERMPAWDRSWRALRGLRLPTGIRIAANWESRPGIPGRLAQAQRLAAELGQGSGA